jgi:small subunit ribosomal protein S4e
MAHIKKTKMPKTWPVPRKGKGKRYVAVPSHATAKGISLLFLLRDVLKLAQTRKEVRYMTLNGMVMVNNKIRHDENFPVQVFDVLNLEKAKKNYRLEIVNKKFSLLEISDKEAGSKIVKIIGKKILGKGKVQMNLDDGQNFLSDVKFSVGDSVVLDTKKNIVSKILGLKKGAKVEIIGGKHAGEKGELVGFEELVRGQNYEIKLENGTVRLPYKTILVIA